MKKLAQVNGFSKTTLDTIIRKHRNKTELRKWTSLPSLKNNSPTRNSFNYFPSLTNKMKNVLKKHDVQMVFSSKNQLSNLLGGTKDTITPTDKSGICMATCSCGKKYIGLTKRALKKRITEHLRYVRNEDTEETALTEHVVTNKHKISPTSFKLLEGVRDVYKLNIAESLHIFKNRASVVNKDNGNAYSTLFELIRRRN